MLVFVYHFAITKKTEWIVVISSAHRRTMDYDIRNSLKFQPLCWNLSGSLAFACHDQRKYRTGADMMKASNFQRNIHKRIFLLSRDCARLSWMRSLKAFVRNAAFSYITRQGMFFMRSSVNMLPIPGLRETITEQ